MNVQDVMTRSVCSCNLGDPLSLAAQILWENDCGCLPVKDAEGRVVGMLTDRDICMAAYTQGRPLAELCVDSAMSREVHKVGPDEPLPRAQRLMREQQVRRLPVVDADGRAVGLLSLNDLACEAARDPTRKPRDGVDLEAVAITLAAVCRPRQSKESRGAKRESTAPAQAERSERPFAGAT